LDYEQSLLRGLPHGDRVAMAWVRQATPASASFAVVTGRVWWAEGPAEWFPALTKRRSVATIQGTEWLAGQPTFQKRPQQTRQLRAGGSADVSCLLASAAQLPDPFTYVYVEAPPASNCCLSLLYSLSNDSRFVPVYSGRGAAIFLLTGEQ